jgi:predicted  nucleic acid-binding Zn-ribbon protein
LQLRSRKQNQNNLSDSLTRPGTSRPFREHHSPPAQATHRMSAPAPEVADQIDGIAASLNEVDPRSSRRLRELATSLTTETGRQRWSDVDLRRAFNTDRLSHSYAVRREGGYAPNTIEIADKVRNVLVLVPILLTWAALGEAATAYDRYIAENPEQANQPFLLLWQRGFGGEASWLSPTFSTVALIDAVVIMVIIMLTFYAHGRREKQEDLIADTASEFQADFDNALAEATVLLATDKSSRPIQLADSVERLADRFERSSQSLLNQLQVEHDRLDHLAGRREKEFADFGVFASGMRAGAEEMHRLLVDLRQVSSGLERALEDLSGEVGAAGDQQRTLVTAVSNLERMTSSSIQSDQAVSRQMSTAANNLAETADKAISGAENAAQASRVAVDAVRGISSIAQQISESQARVEQVLASQVDASGALAESLRSSTSSSQSTARTLNDIGGGLSKIREEFERLSTQTGQHANALNGLLAQQADIAKDISQVVREIGSVSLTSGQRQREVNQDLQHLVQRLDGLANTLNRLVQQTPSAENLQQAFTTALRAELARSSSDSEAGSRWTRSTRT